MSNHIRLDGFDAFVRQLQTLPEEIRAEARGILVDETEQAAAEIAQRYRAGGTGNLQRSVRTRYPSESVLIGIAQATAPHAHLYEWGTRDRRGPGGAYRGRMPAADRARNIVAIADRHRARLRQRLADLLRRIGFQVEGV